MKKIFFCLISIITLASCNKETGLADAARSNEELPRIHTITNAGNGQGILYTYDGNGRLSSFTDTTNQRTSMYAHSDYLVTEKVYDNAGNLIEVYNYDLDANGLVVRKTSSADPGSIIKFTYNSEKQLVRAESVLSVKHYSYAGEQLVSTVETFNTGDIIRQYFVYDTGVKNTITSEYYGLPIWGASSPYALQRRVDEFYLPSGSLNYSVVYYYAYETDIQSRITKVITNGDIKQVQLYTYY